LKHTLKIAINLNNQLLPTVHVSLAQISNKSFADTYCSLLNFW